MTELAPPRLTPPFPGNLWLLEERYERWLQQAAGEADADRIFYHQSLVVPYALWQQRLDRVLSEIWVPRNDRLTVMIEGPPRTGKSTFAFEVLLRVLHETRVMHGRVWSHAESEDDINPVIAVKGSTGQHADFMRSVMGAVDLPAHGTAEEMLARFAAYCRRHFVRVLLIDDVHVTNSREAGVENFYKRLLDLVPCIIFTAVDFNLSPLPRPVFAPPRRASTLEQLWGRAAGGDDPSVDKAIRFAPQERTKAGRAAFVAAIVTAGKALRLENQAGSDLTSVATAKALRTVHGSNVGAMLSHIAQAAASAVGASERVGSVELGLATQLGTDAT